MLREQQLTPNKSELSNDKLLIIRMLASADVCAIGLPAIRFFQQALPNTEIHFLTFGEVAKVIKAAESSVVIHELSADEWPDDFFQAMESFLGLAEQVIGEEYTQIVNLDSAFMPCFLSRFLKDAGEPVVGNFLTISIQDLLSKFQQQTLSPDYVNSMNAYLDSTFMGMYQWKTPWWNGPNLPDGGYPEFYLAKCCGLEIGELQQSITVTADKRLVKKGKSSKVIGLCLDQSEDGYAYPYTEQLKKSLTQQGYTVWLSGDSEYTPQQLLKLMAASSLVVCKASGYRWYAQSVNCPVLLVTGNAEPAMFMPDFATDQVAACVQHGPYQDPLMAANQLCSCDRPEDLAESIGSIFEYLADEAKQTKEQIND